MSAFAQADTPTSRVEVTGSRIRTVDLETAQPVLKMTSEQIQKSGLITVGDILNQLTSAGPPDFSKGATLTSNREQGGQYINFRNLGAERLLVLVDGKRWTQSVAGYTDMSTVPSSMIDRIEILKDGASSIYGSDAIAGVVNIILKKKLTGGTATAYKGQNQKGDGKTEDYALSYGAYGENGSLMFGVTHNKQDTVWARDRFITSTSYGPDHQTDGLGVGQFGRIRQVASNGSATGFNYYLNSNGTWQAPGVGADARNPANYHTYTGDANDKFNSTNQMMFQSPSELTSIFTKGTYDLPAGMHFTSTAMFAERTASTQNAGYPLNSLTKSNFPVYVDKDSYYNPYGNSVAGAGKGQDLFFYRRTIEVPRVTENKNQTVHIDAAIDGEFSVAGKTFNWDVGYNHSAVTGVVNGTGNINLINLKTALGPSFMNANGVVQCGTSASPIPLNLCTPFNILGGPNASTPEALKYIMSNGQGTYGSTINSATANITGEVLTLPAGALAMAGGVERREVRGYDRPGQFEQSGYSTDLGANTTQGSYTVKEAYLEANIPVLKNQPFAQLLSFDLATRHSDYSNFGTTNNSKVSFMWKPHADLLTRGTWAEGFRAPALGDTFGGGSQSYDTYLDVCDSRYGAAASNPVVAANCAKAGVPANFRQLNATGTAVTGGGAQTPFPFSTGLGNASLQPETAKTKTVGFVYNPYYVPGLSVGADWFKINVENRITGITASYTLNQCYITGVQDFCKNVTRGSTGQITNLVRGNANLGSVSTEGLDLSLNYRLPRNQYGQFALRSESTYLKSYKTKSTATADPVEYAGEYGYARFKTNASLDWSLGNWNATYTMRFTSHQKDQCWDAGEKIECTNPDGNASFGAYNVLGGVTLHDLSVGYTTSWKGKVLVGVNNLFEKKPRIVYESSSSGTKVDPDQPVDRFFYVRYTQAF
ncbi:TonB-dependent receptor domain-containing protein [Duganella fentianensis]|nr:TonB-dependent receptor [Duganella fentianensis]